MPALVRPALGLGASVLGSSARGASGLKRRLRRGRTGGRDAPAPGVEVSLRTRGRRRGARRGGLAADRRRRRDARSGGLAADRRRRRDARMEVSLRTGGDAAAPGVEVSLRTGGDAAAPDAGVPLRTGPPLLPGDAVIGYMTVRPGTRASARRAAVSGLRRACERSGWRLDGVVCDGERDGVLERPGLARALARIARREAAGLLVADADRAAGTPAALADLTDAVRAAGGGFAIVAAEDRAGAVSSNRRAAAARRDAVRGRIAALRAEGLAPQAIAETLNEEGVPPPAPELAWQPWNVREASGAWPPRGPDRRLPRGSGWTLPGG